MPEIIGILFLHFIIWNSEIQFEGNKISKQKNEDINSDDLHYRNVLSLKNVSSLGFLTPTVLIIQLNAYFESTRYLT